MFVDVFIAGIALASFLPPPVVPEPQGHQVTPEVNSYVVFEEGQPFNGGPTQNTVFGVPRTPSVARVGSGFDVAFNADTTDPLAPEGIFVCRDATDPGVSPTTVFLRQSTVPVTIQGLGTGMFIGNMTTVPPPAIGPAGHVAQTAFVSKPGVLPSSVVLLLRAPGPTSPLISVCREGQEIVTGDPTQTYGTVTAPFSVTAAGQVGFHTSINGAVSGDNALMFADVNQTLQIVARKNGPAPGPGGGVFNVIGDTTVGVSRVRFDSNGRAAYLASTLGPTNSGVWLDDGFAVSRIADQNTTADGYSPQTFLKFFSPTVTATGSLAFRGCVDSNCNFDGIWRSTGGQPVLIAKDSGTAPDDLGAPDETFDSFSNPVVGASGTLAFHAVLKSTAAQGIWRWTSAQGLRRVVKQGDVLRASPYTFGVINDRIAVADWGTIAFEATMSDSKDALFVTSELGAIVKVAKVGESFPIGGVNKSIASIDFIPGSSAQGNGGFVHEIGAYGQIAAIVYVLQFSDNTRAVILTTIE